MSSTDIEQAHTPAKKRGEKKPNFVLRIILFIKQVIAELKKVNTPTWKQLRNYFFVVLGFVIVMMVFVTLLDQLFGFLTLFVFGTAV
ncbi:preprotein translocase subunit SecE [Leucobacter sp. OH2974_COT-288]|uniref:Protein translocase subunit SecE n=1 Tax=Canibacter oris TaxID=1365628 RepID=A0A840DJ14_9MICO|nr:preprotein translocase subunit SecE [Canibacter oris]RRD35734.1 preprotein translocase subunit SecE [Leucobacter sp. OH2974_COT-288]